jgi:hypothetical protein
VLRITRKKVYYKSRKKVNKKECRVITYKGGNGTPPKITNGIKDWNAGMN